MVIYFSLVPKLGTRLYTYLTVGRNKPVRTLAQDRRFRHSEAQPTLAIAGRAYSGLRIVSNRLVYKDENLVGARCVL